MDMVRKSFDNSNNCSLAFILIEIKSSFRTQSQLLLLCKAEPRNNQATTTITNRLIVDRRRRILTTPSGIHAIYFTSLPI